MDEKKLISLARNGDKDAFRELIIKYEPQIAGTVIGMLGPGPEAEDVGQETFVRFYRALPKFRGEASLSTYLTRIAINLCLNVIRKRKIRKMVFFQKIKTAASQTRDPVNMDSLYTAKELINRGLRMLDNRFRTDIILRYMNGYTSEETAEILNIPKGTVMSRLARGMDRLKEILKPLYEEEKNGEGEE